MSLLKRNLIIGIGSIEVRDPMKIVVKVTKDSDSNEPDFAQVTIYNLSANTRSTLAEADDKIEIYGGYGEQEDLIFVGDIQAVSSIRSGTEWSTTIIAGDGATAMKQAVANKTYEKPISNRDLLDDLVKISGLSELPVDFVDISDGASILRGVTISGPAADELTRITKGLGLTWDINDGQVVISKYETARPDQSYRIAIDTGMVGSPEWVNSGQDLGTVNPKDGHRIKVRSLCLPSIRPNDRVSVESISMDGRIGSFSYDFEGSGLSAEFKVVNVKHNLDSRDGEFSTLIEGRLL